MERDVISQIEIDAEGRLHVAPSERSFPQIYREAMEVNWHSSRGTLYSPRPKEWPYSRWFQQILAATAAQGCELHLTSDTKWLNVDPGLKADLVRVAGNEA